MFSISIKPEVISSQVSEITQLTEFPWRFLPSMLSELVHYSTLFLVQEKSHLSHWLNLALCLPCLCIVRLFFLVHVLSHELHFNVVSSSSLGIAIEVRSQSTLFGTYILTSVMFLLSLVWSQSLLYGSYVSLLEHLYSHSSPSNS